MSRTIKTLNLKGCAKRINGGAIALDAVKAITIGNFLTPSATAATCQHDTADCRRRKLNELASAQMFHVQQPPFVSYNFSLTFRIHPHP